MATTTNYGWTTPDNTDLVKDGALAIRTLGSAIDTSMNTALGTKKAGMVLLNTTSFSGVASVSLPADSFTSTYDSYILYIKFTAFSNDASTFIRFRKAGTDATGSNYYFAAVGYKSSNATYNSANNPTADGFFLQDSDSGSSIKPTFAKVELLNPKVLDYSSVFTQHIGADTIGNTVSQYGGGNHNVIETYDSATVRVNAGTMSGVLTLYGVNK